RSPFYTRSGLLSVRMRTGFLARGGRWHILHGWSSLLRLRARLRSVEQSYHLTKGPAASSYLCHMPPQTPGQHGELPGHAEADRCCVKSLIGSALVSSMSAARLLYPRRCHRLTQRRCVFVKIQPEDGDIVGECCSVRNVANLIEDPVKVDCRFAGATAQQANELIEAHDR